MGNSFKLLSVLLFVFVVSLFLTSCNAPDKVGGEESTGDFTLSGTTGSSSDSSSDQCVVFANNTNDFNTCQTCKTTLGNGATLTELVQCVHENNSLSAGACVGLVCGEGQVADLTNCICTDANAPTTIGAAPGQEDSETPHVQVGLTIMNKYCPVNDDFDLANARRWDCLYEGVASNTAETEPVLENSPPANVFQDTGYIRWDLGLDHSQFPPVVPYENNKANKYSSATLIGRFDLSLQLKPNTELDPTSADTEWQDCAEHFSGHTDGTTDFLTTVNKCEIRNGGVSGSPDAKTDNIITMVNSAGSALLNFISFNGAAANFNFSLIDTPTSQAIVMGTGMAQEEPSANAASWDRPEVSGLFNNIGYYKYSWGPITVQRSNGTDVASSIATGRLAINSNLGFNPVSAIESTAFSPKGLTNGLTTRDCTDTSDPCVVTMVYRTTGGAVAYQSLSPSFTGHSTAVGMLPSGVTAVSTPKIVEDTSQLTTTDTTVPAKLRVFVRGDDGNIHMSKGEAGEWSDWMSLGRPWTVSETVFTASNMSNLNPVYWPFNNTFATNDGLAAPYNDNPNNGISITGEPTVVPLMNSINDNTGFDTITGMIMVLVRVSNIRSDTGALGNYHNAVFYTLGIADSTGTSNSFDNSDNWTPWMPVREGANIFQIQGNPTAFAEFGTAGAAPVPDSDPIFVVMGTSRGSTYLGPVAPANAAGAANEYDPATGIDHDSNWFNYGSDLIRTGINMDTVGVNTSALVRALNPRPVGATDPFTWDASRTLQTNDAAYLNTDATILSDWTVAHISSTRKRVFATAITGFTEIEDVDDGTVDQYLHGDFTTFRRTIAYDFIVNDAAATKLRNADDATADPDCINDYTDLEFYGTPYPIYPRQATTWPTVAADATAVRVDKNGNVNTASGTDGSGSSDLRDPIMVFGRGICDDPNVSGVAASCDLSTPAVSIGIVDGDVDIDNDGTCEEQTDVQYYSGAIMEGDTGVAISAGEVHPMFHTPATADIVPIYSNSLQQDANDVPVYVITRSKEGKIMHGVWGSISNGAAGVRRFVFFTRGGIAN